MISLPVRLVLAIFAAILAHHFFPEGVVQWFYTVALVLKDFMVLMVPFLIVISLFTAFFQNEKKGGSWVGTIGILFLGVYLSGVIGSVYSYALTMPIFSFINLSLPDMEGSKNLVPLWQLDFQFPFRNEYVLGASLMLAPLLHRLAPKGFQKISHYGQVGLLFLLQRIFMPLFPLLVFGFSLDLLHQGVMSMLIGRLGWVLATIIFVEASYLILFYWVGFHFSFTNTRKGIQRVLPAGILGFCAASSAAALPLNLQAAAKNTEGSSAAEMSISTTVNIHLMGDSLNMIILALAVMKMFGLDMPDFFTFLLVASGLALSRFAAAAIPGGSTFVMMPVLEKYLHMNAEMIAIVVALDILLDPLTTFVNVLGNGGFAIFFHRFSRWKGPKNRSIPNA